MALSVPIVSEFNGKGVEKAIEKFKQLETAGEKAQFALEKAALPAAAALAGLTAVAGKAVKAAVEDQKSQKELARQLRNSTGATDEQISAVEKMIAAYEAAAGVADTELRTAYGNLIRGTNDATKAEEGLALALDISAATGKDLASVTEALSGAYAGNMRGLRSLSPEMAALIKEGISADEAFDKLAGTFGGAMTEEASTAEGRMRRFGIAIENAQESIGYALLPVVEAVLPYVERFGQWAQDNTKTLLIIGGVIGGLAGAILAVNGALKLWKAAQIIMNGVIAVFNAVMAANPIVLIVIGIGLLIAALVIAYNKFEGFRKVVDAVFGFIKSAIEMSLNVVKGYFEAVFGFYKTLFNNIAKLWNNSVGKISFKVPDWVPLIGGKGFSVPQIPLLAAGGIVTGPTLAMIGEKGPEAVVPLDRMGGMGTTINIYSTIADESLPEKLVQALRTYNRTTGPVRIQVI